MNRKLWFLRSVLGVALAWGVLWTLLTMAIGFVFWVVDPTIIDPGEGPLDVGPLFFLMGALSGVAFAILLLLARRGRAMFDLSLKEAALWGLLGSAIVQVGYLGHGDHGLADNIRVGLLLAAFGAAIAMIWSAATRRWSGSRSSLRPTPGIRPN